MFEHITFDILLQRMLDRVPNDIDKREGGVIWSALAPAAVELQEMYIALDSVLKEAFADTASREYLIKRAAEQDIYPSEATYAIFKGVFNIDVPIGARFSLDNFNYIVTKKISPGTFELKCETVGSEPNQYLGTLIPIEYINGLTNAELTEVLIYGEDAESTESLRSKFFDEKRTPVTSGNVAHYKKWANEVAGVGNTKVFPLKNGEGTVEVLIIDSNKRAASIQLIESVKNHIDNERPIGAKVTVGTALEKMINISGKVKLAPGYSTQQAQNEFTWSIQNYFKEIAFVETYVSAAKIGSYLLETNGVIDFSNLLLNNATINISLAENEIPVLGSVTLEVV